MKRFFLLLLALTLTMGASAQLSVLEVMQKSAKAVDLKKGLKGTATVKMVGFGDDVYFEYADKMMRTKDGEDITYINDSTIYEYEKKKNTVTISTEKDACAMLLMPIAMVQAFAVDSLPDNPLDTKKLKMEKTKEGYEITFDADGNKMIFIIDANNYKVKSMKIKKSIITILSYSYKNLAPFSDAASLKYDSSKFPGAKIVDERGKAKKK